MSIPCPSITWPSVLEEIGPAEDPTIALAGMASVGSTPFRITAIRVEPRLKFMPDYRPDLDRAAYGPVNLETLLEELGEVADTDHAATIRLESGPYVFWMTPAPEGDASSLPTRLGIMIPDGTR